ncbi:MAG: hypothetical protein KGM98_02825, partial [Bacteroidota bacterium]|nr:hypothetical protein [Bacteroidota bacterium]
MSTFIGYKPQAFRQMIPRDRKFAKQLARQFIVENKPRQWFEVLYRQAGYRPDMIPWADMELNPNLKNWIETKPSGFFEGRKILKVGCGLGDDSEYWS